MEENVKHQKTTTRQVLADVYEEVNWAYLAKNNHSIYNRLLLNIL